MLNFWHRCSTLLASPWRLPRLGLDIGRQHLRLAVLRRSRSRPQLLGLAQRRFGHVICDRGRITDLDLLCRATRALLDECGVADGILHTALGLPAAAAVPLTLPGAASEVQRLAQVQAEMAQRHPQAQEERVAHYCVPGPGPAAGAEVRVLALFPSLMDIEDRGALAASLQLRPGPIALRETCIADFLRRTHQAPGAGVLQVDLDEVWLALPGRDSQHLDWSARRDPPVVLLQALAPLLRPLPGQLLLSGDAHMLATLAGLIDKYAALPTRVAAWSPPLRKAAHQAPPPPAFHAAMALAANGQA